jgi:hypothetical protein
MRLLDFGRGPGNPGIVDEDIEAAEFSCCLIEQPLN